MASGLDAPDARALAWQAQTLVERIDALDAPDASDAPDTSNASVTSDDADASGDSCSSDAADESPPDDGDRATAFLDEWRDRLGDDGRLERRLSLDGLSEAACAACVRRDEWPEGEPLPDWIEIADELVAAAEEWDGDAGRGCEFAGREYPFEHALAPWVECARERLSVPLDRFADAATDSLAEWLLGRLVEVTAEPLFVEFKAFAASRADSEAGFDSKSQAHYDAFVREVTSADGLSYLFTEYPVLARFAGQTVRQWVAAVEELDRRLRDDWDRLREAFTDGKPARVADVDVLTSDRHADGRAVFALRFDSGDRVAYKPRSVEPEAVFADVLADLNRRTDFEFRTLACLARDGYGWMEWVAREDCSSPDAVARYYRRAGGLLCLAYALGVTDCHFENVVAAGEHPVIVDAETVMHPEVPREKLPGNAPLNEANFDSVLRTGLLPMDGADGEEYRIGGFTATEGPTRAARRDPDSWTATNTDAAEYDPEVYGETSERNLPTLDGERATVETHLDDFERGFREMYRHLEARGPDLLDDHAEALDGMETRVLVAPTRLYSSMIRAITSVDCLSSGLDVTAKLDGSVADLLAEETTNEGLWRIYGWEREAVVRTDVPRFTTRPDDGRIRFPAGTGKEEGGETVEGSAATTGEFVERSGYETTRRRLSNLDSADCETQWEHVRSAIETVTTSTESGLDAD